MRGYISLLSAPPLFIFVVHPPDRRRQTPQTLRRFAFVEHMDDAGRVGSDRDDVATSRIDVTERKKKR